MLELSENNNHLEITKVNETHNHVVSQQLFDHLPTQRSLLANVIRDVKEALQLKANSKLLQQKIQLSTGKKTTLKDISNLRQYSKADVSTNDMEDIVTFLKQQRGSSVEIVVDEENVFKGLFYQDQYMKHIYRKYPEIILVDATYKLLELRLPIYLVLNIDGDGQSDIIALFILADETKLTIQKVVEILKNNNDAWVNTNVVMSDKDFVEREAFSNCFPDASLLICLYHTFRSFRREITCEKMGITSAERMRCLEIIQKIAYSKSSAEYEENLLILENTKLKSVIDYYTENWAPIKQQWVCAFKDETFNLGERTNNRVESTFNKLKSVCTKHTNLMQFFMEFFSFLGAIRNERNHHHIMSITRRNIVQLEDLDERAYHDQLTPYAFTRVKSQFLAIPKRNRDQIEKVKNGNYNLKKPNGEIYELTSTKCSCSFMSKMGLPCSHLFKLRSFLSLPLFENSIANKRWSRQFYHSCLDEKEFLEERPSHSSVELVVTETDVEPMKVLTQAQKYRKLIRTCQLLASVGSEGGMGTYTVRLEQLQNILQQWQKGEDVVVLTNDKDFSTDLSREHLTLSQPNKSLVEPFNKVNELEEKSAKIEEEVFPGPAENVIMDSNMEEKSNKKVLDQNITLKNVKMPPKMVKMGRPKGADTTAIGTSAIKKRRQLKMAPFSKLQPKEKDRIILLCILKERLDVHSALEGSKLLCEDDIKEFNVLPDTLRDEKNVDIYRVERYFNKQGWKQVLRALGQKMKTEWTCLSCAKVVKEGGKHKSIVCERCLLWCHLSCSGLTKLPKSRFWYCKLCKAKFS